MGVWRIDHEAFFGDWSGGGDGVCCGQGEEEGCQDIGGFHLGCYSGCFECVSAGCGLMRCLLFGSCNPVLASHLYQCNVVVGLSDNISIVRGVKGQADSGRVRGEVRNISYKEGGV